MILICKYGLYTLSVYHSVHESKINLNYQLQSGINKKRAT